MKTVLTIAGSDSIGGAGIQADIKTITVNGAYAMTAITALTAQNTLGVSDIMEVTPEFLKKQIDAVFTDIRPDAVKIGMVSSAKLISVIAERLKFYQAKNIVLDPVMISTSGSELLQKEAVKTFTEELIPLADIITPNIPEAEALSGLKIKNKSDMEKCAIHLGNKFSTAVLLKGGHSINNADDILYNGELTCFKGKKIENPNTHGTGCTLSSAIASNLAKGYTTEVSVQKAKDYITRSLSAMLDIGKGSGPINHLKGVY